MQVQQQDKNERERKKQEHQSAIIAKYVMDALGQPDELRKVQVKQLWDDHYRVNVLIGENAASARVAHSFFVAVNCDGKVIACTPNVRKQY